VRTFSLFTSTFSLSTPTFSLITPSERSNWRLIGDKEGIHWPELDEDISIENLLLGKPSGESQSSLERWLEKRAVA
jgi:hypothetical protein